MIEWALIIIIGTSQGMTTVSHNFTSEVNCRQAGLALVIDATKRGGTVTAWGCYAK